MLKRVELEAEIERYKMEIQVLGEVINSQNREIEALKLEAALVPGMKREISRLREEIARLSRGEEL